MKDCPILPPTKVDLLEPLANKINFCDKLFSEEILKCPEMTRLSIAPHERLRITIMIDAIVGVLFGMSEQDMRLILADCDYGDVAANSQNFNPKGFWRVDKERPPEQRQTVLTLVAFHELERLIEQTGDQEAGIKAFLALNDGEGWMLPEQLRLADYGLGHDAEAEEFRPVASAYGPRFYDWQLAQTPEEFRKECEIHAYNLNIGRGGDNVPEEEIPEAEKQEIVQPTLF